MVKIEIWEWLRRVCSHAAISLCYPVVLKSGYFKNAGLAVRVVGAVFVLKIWILRVGSGWVGFKIMRMTFEKRLICSYTYDKFEAELIYGRGWFVFL